MDPVPPVAREKSPRALRLFSLPFLLTGGLIVGIGAGWIPMDPSQVHAPPWILVACGLTFLCGGAAVFASSLAGGSPRLVSGLGLAVVVLIGAIVHWVAFGPGERQFSSSFGIGGTMQTAATGERAGRFWFGAFAVGLDVGVLAIALRAWRGRSSERR